MADADWAVKHSTSGHLFTMAKAAISWGSKKQPSIALSSCEAEIMAALPDGSRDLLMAQFKSLFLLIAPAPLARIVSHV